MSKQAKVRLVTRKEALERFIQERVLGERGFSIEGNSCLYAGPCGGCEIGQYLPREIAQRADTESWPLTQVAQETVGLVEFEGLSTEELSQRGPYGVRTRWWTLLQRAHDQLAYSKMHYGFDADGNWSYCWGQFEEVLRDLCDAEAQILEEEEGGRRA